MLFYYKFLLHYTEIERSSLIQGTAQIYTHNNSWSLEWSANLRFQKKLLLIDYPVYQILLYFPVRTKALNHAYTEKTIFEAYFIPSESKHRKVIRMSNLFHYFPTRINTFAKQLTWKWFSTECFSIQNLYMPHICQNLSRKKNLQ